MTIGSIKLGIFVLLKQRYNGWKPGTPIHSPPPNMIRPESRSFFRSPW